MNTRRRKCGSTVQVTSVQRMRYVGFRANRCCCGKLFNPKLTPDFNDFFLRNGFATFSNISATIQVATSKAVPQKAIYATVPSHHLVVCGGTTAVKMTPQIQAQMINQFVAQQQQQQRRISGKVSMQNLPQFLVVDCMLTKSI